ncbi:MAG: START domain-containing protein, partial [Pseudomonas sp.]
MGSLARVGVVCALSLLIAATARAEDWQLVKDEEGIRVYLSPVPGSKYKAYRGVARIKADIATLRALQEDVSGSCAWIHECREQRLLKSEGAHSWTYSRFNTPWPVTPRDSVIHVTTQESADGSVTRILEGVPDYLPQEKGFVRVSKVEGLWKL